MGKVYLIGSGPGDAELITVKAIRKLKECTAVMYDRLAGCGILRYVNRNCEIYYCGKEPGCHYKTQDEINDMLVKLAKSGHTVGRIKGGDPYIFGRGGEEALRLTEEGLEFEVIPGISSSISVLNYAGIPVTYRKIARGFHVFTGKTAGKLDINWEAVSKIGGTLIFLMGFNNLHTICTKLIENDMNIKTNCAVIMRGTTSKQKKVVGNLGNIEKLAMENGINSPCIIVIGEVVKFNDKLDWYENKPLFGKNICITRAKPQAKKLREQLSDLGAEVTEINSIVINSTNYNLKKYIEKLSDYDYIVLTSVNGVKAFFNFLISIKYDIRKIKAEFAAIGPATGNEIMKRGIVPKITSEKFVAESLFEKMKSVVSQSDKIFLPRSSNSRPYLAEALKDIGCIVDECFTYKVSLGQMPDNICIEDVDIIVFTSPSTVKNSVKLIGLENIKKKKVISIGPITGRTLKSFDIDYVTCEKYNVDGILDKLKKLK